MTEQKLNESYVVDNQTNSKNTDDLIEKRNRYASSLNGVEWSPALYMQKLIKQKRVKKEIDEVLKKDDGKISKAIKTAIETLEHYQNPYLKAESVPDFYNELDFGHAAEDALDAIYSLLDEAHRENNA